MLGDCKSCDVLLYPWLKKASNFNYKHCKIKNIKSKILIFTACTGLYVSSSNCNLWSFIHCIFRNRIYVTYSPLSDTFAIISWKCIRGFVCRDKWQPMLIIMHFINVKISVRAFAGNGRPTESFEGISFRKHRLPDWQPATKSKS